MYLNIKNVSVLFQYILKQSIFVVRKNILKFATTIGVFSNY
jgi:hypothetical protein